MSKESKEEVRDKTDDIVEERKLGKLGMKEQPSIGLILSLQQLPIFLPSTEETLGTVQKS